MVETEARAADARPSYRFSATLLRRPRRPPPSAGPAAAQAAPVGHAVCGDEEGGRLAGWERVALGRVELGFDDVYPDFDN